MQVTIKAIKRPNPRAPRLATMLKPLVALLCVAQVAASSAPWGFVLNPLGISSQTAPARQISTKENDLLERDFVIDATLDECFEVAVGFEEHHPKFIGSLRSVNVLERDGNGIGKVVEFKAGLAMFPAFQLPFVNEYEVDYPHGLKFHAKSGFKRFEGSYTFERLTATRTRVKHQLLVDPTPAFISVPDFVKKGITSAIISDSVKNFKGYVEEYSREQQKAANVTQSKKASFWDNHVFSRLVVA